VTGWWFSLRTLASSTNKTYSRDIAEILWKVALSTINKPTKQQTKYVVQYQVTLETQFFFLKMNRTKDIFISRPWLKPTIHREPLRYGMVEGRHTQ
jgi:hypothetical protein